MTYVPVILNSDNRASKGMAPLNLSNWYVEPISQDNAKLATAVLLPTPGLTERVTIGTIQSVWQEDGVRTGLLFVVANSKLYSVSSSWVATEIGALDAGEAEFTGIRDDLFIAVNTRLWNWDGSTLTEVTDVDLPDVSTMITISQRLFLHSENDDTLTWSDTLDGTSVEALAFTTAEQSPDPLRRLIKLSGQAVAFGSTGIEILRAVNSTTLPFQNVTNQAIEESNGILGKYCAAKTGDKCFLMGGNLAAYVMYGMSLQPITPNFELKEDLLSLSESDRALTRTWAYRDGVHEYFVVRPVGKPARVYDHATKLWHSRESYGLGYWAPQYHTHAYGYDVVALQGGDTLYTLDRGVYSDAGEPVIREATLRFSGSQRESIGSFCIDAATFDHPVSGQGSSPQMMVSFSEDARTVPSNTRSDLIVDIPPVGERWKATIWGVGQMTPSEGMLVRMRVSDPLGVALYGAWINEGMVA